MSAPLHNDTLQPGVFSGSAQTVAFRPPASSRDPSATKRVCFYKSGDLQFSGHRLVINSRTFKTFDALLDALSKKVPLPFGVRTITTPKGTHTIQNLEDLRDGASYVCSDQKKVKPFNLDEVNRRQVPWNTTRPSSAARQGRRALIRQLVKKSEVTRSTKVVETAVAVWTPKRLVVFKNRDPSTRRTIVLQRRTAPTFEALLDYLSQVLQFPVVKLYTADGRRVEGLPALILCSGIVVAAGNESFRLGNYNLQGPSQPSKSIISESIAPAKAQPLLQKKQSTGSRPRSRNFSLSSERYFVDQINKSLNGSLSQDNEQNTGSMDPENNQPLESENMEMSDCVAGIEERDRFIMPSEDDIEKSFRVNQDGSMTVEMKVRLTIKQEEMIHWTTTLSRTCAHSQQRAVCSQPVSPDNNNYSVREANGDSYESKEDNTPSDKSVGFNKERRFGSSNSEALEKPKPTFQRLPTPGPRRVRRKEVSVESIKRVSQNEVQESTVGAYSYMERTAEGELTEGYCVVSRSSSGSTRPVPKPRKNSSHKNTHSSHRSSRTAEVLQLQNNGKEVTETVMHIYESQGMYENYLANTQITGDKNVEFRAKTKEARKPDSTDSGPRSSSNDCDVDLTRQSVSSDSQNSRKKELLSLSSGQSSSTRKASKKQLEGLDICQKEDSKEKNTDIKNTKMSQKSVKSKEGNSSDTTGSNKRQKDSVSGSFKDLRKSQSHTGLEKKTVSSAESEKQMQKLKKKKKDGVQKSQSSNLNSSDHIESSEKDLNLDEAATLRSPKKINIYNGTMRDSQQNVNACHTDTVKSPVKKILLDVQPPLHSASFKTLSKQRSLSECRTKSPKENKELSESISMPAFHSPPCSVHQYVENWLNKIQPESVLYMDEMGPQETEPEPEARAQFWIGSGSADSSEIRSEPDKEGRVKECASLEATTAERPVSRPPVLIRCEGESVETQRIRGFCKSMPSVRIHPAEQESGMRMNKSSVALVPIQPVTESEASQNTKVNTRSGMKPVLEQLCLSIQSIRRTSSETGLTSLEKEKSSSLPDFSSQVASVFGSPSRAFLSFLSLMTLKDGTSNPENENPVSNSGSYPEALQVMQSLEKIASIEDEEELKASLTSLQSSTSSQFKKSWRDFQEKNEVEGSPPLSPRLSEQEFALEVDSEGEHQDKEQDCGINKLMDELNMSEDLRREISSFVDGGLTSSERTKLTKKQSNETSENDATKDDFLDEEEGSKESESSCPPEEALLSKDKKSGTMESVLTRDDTGLTDLVKCMSDMVGNVPAAEERYQENETCLVDKLDIQDHHQNNLEETIKGQENEKNEHESECVETDLHTHVPDVETKDLSRPHSEVNDDQDNKSEKGDGYEEDTYQETMKCIEQPGIISVSSETEDVKAPTAVAEHDKFNCDEHEQNENHEAEDQNNAVNKEEHFSLNGDINNSDEEEQQNETFNREDDESCKKMTLESLSNEHDHGISKIEEENPKEGKDARSPALEKSADDTDTDINVDAPEEENDVNHCEDIVFRASEHEDSDAETHQSLKSDQSEQSDNYNAESESEQQLQALEEKGIIKKEMCSDEEKEKETDEDEDKQSCALDSEEDFDVEKCPAMSDQDGEHSPQDQTQSCKSQDTEGEDELQILQEEHITEKQTYKDEEQSDQDKTQSCKSRESDAELALDEEKDEHDNKHNVSSSDKDFNAESHSPEMSDQNSEDSDQNKYQESEGKDELQILEEVTFDEDFNSEQNYATTYKDKEPSDQDMTQSCKSQESEAEHKFGTPEEDNVTDQEGEEQEDKLSSVSDSDKDYPARSDPEDELSDHAKAMSCKSQESEAEFKLETPEEEKVIKEKDEHEDKISSDLDFDKDVSAEADLPAVSDQEDELSDQAKTILCKSQESEAEFELGTPDKENGTEEKDEQKDKLSSDLDSNKDYPARSDQEDEISYQAKAMSCKSHESEAEFELETPDEENVIEEKDEQEGKMSSDFDSDKDATAVSDQEDELSDQDKTWSCKSQESEAEFELRTPGEENDTEEKDEHEDKMSSDLDSDKEVSVEAELPAVSDQEGEFSDARSYKSQESEAEHVPQAKQQESNTEEQTSSFEEKDDEADYLEKQINALDSDGDMVAQTDNSYMPKTKSDKSQDTRTHKSHSEDTVQLEEADAGHGCQLVHPIEISQDLLDFVNLALLSSALTFTYDSNGHLRIEPDRSKIREMSLAKCTIDDQYAHIRLPSPSTSDLSDYRPETSYSGGNLSQVSTDLLTETEDEEAARLSINKSNLKQSYKNFKRRCKQLNNGSVKPNSGTDMKQIASPSLKSINSTASFHECNGSTQKQTYCNSSGKGESVQRVVFHSEADSGDGILIDKGRWLLKENHLIRKSPPVVMGMYENADTTSADTAADNTSEDAPYPPSGTQHSPLAVISSSELEEMAKPSAPKCSYFSMPHSSDSDPFLDNQSINSNKERGDVRKSRELKVCPMGETSKILTKKNGSLPSFASVEFKLPDGKVHPGGDLETGAVERTVSSKNISSRPVQEEEIVEDLNLRCGRHCPIL